MATIYTTLRTRTVATVRLGQVVEMGRRHERRFFPKRRRETSQPERGETSPQWGPVAPDRGAVRTRARLARSQGRDVGPDLQAIRAGRVGKPDRRIHAVPQMRDSVSMRTGGLSLLQCSKARSTLA